MTNLKHCRYCDRNLTVDAFHKRKESPDGLSYKCKECQASYRKARYAGVPSAKAAQLAQMKDWATKNRARSREIKARYEGKDPDFHRERRRLAAIKSRQDNPERARMIGRAWASIRRHRAIGAGAIVLAGLSARVLKKANGSCVYCGSDGVSLTIDHFNPVSKGGCGQWWNLVPCCQSCNSSKKDRDGSAWIELKFGAGRLVEVFHRLNDISAARLP